MLSLLSVKITRVIVITTIGLFMCVQVAMGQGLPARAFDFEGGSLQMQGGVLVAKQVGFLGQTTNQNSLFLILKNESKAAIWVEVGFQVPGTDKVSQEMQMIEPGGGQVMYKVPVEKIVWDTKYPFKVSIFSSEDKKKMVGGDSAYFLFEEKEKQSFEKSLENLKPNQAAIVNGFRELTDTSLTAEVKGTRAEPQLQYDIVWRLFKEESKSYQDCEHKVLKAEDGTGKSVIVSKMGDKAKELEDKLRANGDMVVEKWWVQSCDAVSVYEVLMVKEPQGGTDIMVEKLEKEPVLK